MTTLSPPCVNGIRNDKIAKGTMDINVPVPTYSTSMYIYHRIMSNINLTLGYI